MICAPLRFAARGPAAAWKGLFIRLPSAYPALTLPRLRSGQALGYKSVAATRLARWPTPSIARLFKSCLCLCVSVVKKSAPIRVHPRRQDCTVISKCRFLAALGMTNVVEIRVNPGASADEFQLWQTKILRLGFPAPERTRGSPPSLRMTAL